MMPKFPTPNVRRNFYKIVRKYALFGMPIRFFVAFLILAAVLLIYNPNYFRNSSILGAAKFVFGVFSLSLLAGWSFAFNEYFRIGRDWGIIFYGALLVSFGYCLSIVFMMLESAQLHNSDISVNVFEIIGLFIFVYLGSLMQLIFFILVVRFILSPPIDADQDNVSPDERDE